VVWCVVWGSFVVLPPVVTHFIFERNGNLIFKARALLTILAHWVEISGWGGRGLLRFAC
jgi:hypothetical protein